MESERTEYRKTILLNGRMNGNQNFTAQGSPIIKYISRKCYLKAGSHVGVLYSIFTQHFTIYKVLSHSYYFQPCNKRKGQ